ncbi:MAG: insulinase family protein [Deltaproteobacteria bacterium]|nr:insulinase family protein [Deltaproteobacteria bacterium]
MNKVQIVLLGIIFFLTSEPNYTSEINAIKNLISGVKFYELPNGVKLVHLPQDHAPTFTSVVSIRVGSVDEPSGKKGIAHFLEHLAFKGTKTVGTKNYELELKLLEKAWELEQKQIKGNLSEKDKKQLKELRTNLRSVWKTEEFQSKLADLGGEAINATTSADFTNYIGKFPSEVAPQWIKLELDRLTNPVPRQFFEEMRVILQEREMRVSNNPIGRMYEHFIKLAFPDHPYGYPVIGHIRDLLNLTPQDLLNFHREHYKASKLTLSIVGKLDNEVIKRLIIPELRNLPTQPSDEKKLNSSARFSKHLLVRNNFGTRALMVGYKKNIYPNMEDICVSLAGRILFDSHHGLVYRELVEKEKIFTSVNQSEAPGVRYPNVLLVVLPLITGTDGEHAWRKFSDFVELSINNGFSEDEVKIFKGLILADIAKYFEDRIALAEWLAESTQTYGNPYEILIMINQMLALTSHDLRACASEVLRTNNSIVLISEK